MPVGRPSLLHVFATFAVGGPQIRFATIANSCGDGFRHTVVAMDGNYACAGRLDRGLDLRCEAIDAPKQATFGNIRRFRGLIRQFSPDLLVTYNWGSIEWAMANLPRLVRHIHIEDGFGPEERDAQIRRRVLTRRLVLARSTVVLPSRTLWHIATETWKLSPRRVSYVPNGVDLHRFAPIDHAPEREPVFGTVAALRREKNLPRLLRAFHRVVAAMPARLVIAGSGAEREGLEQLAAELGIADRVAFPGHVDDPAPLYRDFDIFALSSDTEQMPLSIVEAMASGLPVAATDVGDVAAVLAEDNRPFVTLRDDVALADAMLALARDPAKRVQVGAANWAKAESAFDQDRMVATYRALFEGTAN